MQDLRYAIRSLVRQPIFSIVAVLTLALGIGANTAIFSLVYQVLLRPLPYHDPGRLVFVWNVYPSGGGEPSFVAIPDYVDRRAAPAFEDAALVATRSVSLNADAPEQLVALAVTPSFFSTLGRVPALGRAFTDADAVPGADHSVILTHSVWTSRFGGDPAIVGRTVRIDGQTHQIVGVLPGDLELPSRDASLLVPFAFTPMQVTDAERGNEFSQMIARLRPGATIAQADAQMQAITTRLIDRLPSRAGYMRRTGFTGIATGMRDEIVGPVAASLYLLQAGVVLVLLIACANVANLLLMRAAGRQRELALRTSLGASGARILRQLLTEGALLSSAGVVAGLGLGAFAARALNGLMGEAMPRGLTASLQPAALLFAVGLAVLTTIVFGLVPALPALRGRIGLALKEGGTRGTASRGTRGLRATLAASEIALAVVLVIGAGLLVTSFARVSRVNPGFVPDRVLSARLALPASRYSSAAEQQAFWTRLVARVRAMPGVTAVGVVSALPFSGDLNAGSYRVVGIDPPDAVPPHAASDLVACDYFRVMSIPLIEGRLFNDGDTALAPRVAIVDRLFAERRFPGGSPLGRQINFGGRNNYTIVGVVGTTNGGDLAKPVPEARIHVSAMQVSQAPMTLVIKTAGDPAAMAPAVRDAVREIDPEQPIARLRTLDDWIARSLQGRRAPMTLVGLFGVLALVLAAVGIYGVVAFGVAERVREFGLRQALGAQPSSILRMVLGQAARTAGVGIAAGLIAAFAGSRALASMLFDVTPHDPAIFAGTAALLFVVGVLACLVPARRATRVDPMVALREC